jgi:hypothetical protein
MSLNSKALSLPLLLLVSQCRLGAENVVLHFDEGNRDTPLERARDLIFAIPRGTPLKDVIKRVGYPDEVRIHSKYSGGDSEWRRWCYGVYEPGQLPLVGLILISTNLTVDTVRLPCDEWKGAAITNLPTTNPIPRCLIQSVVLTNDTPIRELFYIARVCLTNTNATTPIAMNLGGRHWSTVLQREVYDSRDTLIFAQYPYYQPFPFASGPDLQIRPGDHKEGDIAIFLRDVDMGIPRPGTYQLRVGLSLSNGWISWSERYKFEIEP